MKTPEAYVCYELAEAAKRLANARRVMMSSAAAPSKVAGPVGSLSCDAMVVLGLSAANAFLESLTESEKQQRQFQGEHIKHGRTNDAARCAEIADVFEEVRKKFRRLTGLATERQPQHNGADQPRPRE